MAGISVPSRKAAPFTLQMRSQRTRTSTCDVATGQVSILKRHSVAPQTRPRVQQVQMGIDRIILIAPNPLEGKVTYVMIV